MTLLLIASPSASALKATGNVGVDVSYTDNATLVSANKTDEIITTGRISAAVSENQGALTGNANASLSYVDYLENTFAKQTYLKLGASANWQQIRNVLRWNVNDYFSQSWVDNLAAATPTNTENINVLNLAASWTIRPADRHTITVTPSFSDYYYEISDNDNQQAGLSAGWSYRFRPTIAISLTGAYRDVAYDNSTLGSDHTSKNINIGVNVSGSRSSYAATVGATKVDRESGSGTDGLVARLTATYKVGARSTVNANISTDITDTSSIYLASSLDPNAGDFGNVQTSSDVVRNSVMRVTYNRAGPTARLSAWFELRDLNYQTSPNDRKLQEYGASLGYSLSPGMTASITGKYIETEELNSMLTDKYYRAAGQLGYALSRKLNANAGVQFQNRDGGLPQDSYDEFGVFAGLSYRLSR